MTEPRMGKVIWRCRSHAGFGKLATVGATLLLVVLLYLLSRLWTRLDSVPAKVMVTLFTLAGLGGGYGSLRLLSRPVTLLSVHEGGLLFHRGEHGYRGPGFFVPWTRVQKIQAAERQRIRTVGRHAQSEQTGSRHSLSEEERGVATIPTVGFTVRCDAAWQPPPHLATNGSASSAVLHLDLPSDPRGHAAILTRLADLAHRLGGLPIDVSPPQSDAS